MSRKCSPVCSEYILTRCSLFIAGIDTAKQSRVVTKELSCRISEGIVTAETVLII
jgi:hypothetical protein